MPARGRVGAGSTRRERKLSDIIILGWIDFEGSDRDIWLRHAEELVAATLDEPGCIRHVVVADPHSPTALITHAHYASQEAFDLHVSTEHFKKFAELTKQCRYLVHNVDRFEAKLVRASSAARSE